MSSLAIRHMNFTLQTMAHLKNAEDAAWYASLPESEKANRTHYWHVERKAKRGKKWIFVCQLFATKSEAAEIWAKRFQGRAGYRLRHLLKY